MVQQQQPSILARINILKFLPYKRVSLITSFVIKVLKWIILEHHVFKCIWNGLTQANLPIVLIYWILNSFFSQIWFIEFFPNKYSRSKTTVMSSLSWNNKVSDMTLKKQGSSASTRRLWGLPVASRLGKGCRQVFPSESVLTGSWS